MNSFAINWFTGELTTTVVVDAATKASYSVVIAAIYTVTGAGKVALTVNVKADCSAATQLAAGIGTVLLSLTTVLAKKMPYSLL